jgi:glutamyl-tRNA reductase
MKLRYDHNETLEIWMSRVELYELAQAKKKIAAGESVDQVLERMSKNITNKMLHPVISSLTAYRSDPEAFERSKASYEEQYLKKVPRAYDHVAE